MSTKLIRLGTRGSQLALCQSQLIADSLRASGANVELVIIKTMGDVTDGPLTNIGGEGVFTKRIQQSLLNNEVDLAVHSLKDLPTDSVKGLSIGAVPVREDPCDALVVGAALASTVNLLADLPPASRIGTGSIRRQAQLLNLRNDLVIDDIRGNVDTRLKKLDDGEFNAIVLACAGLKRLGLAHRISIRFPETELAPAVGQGALGLEIRADDVRTLDAITPLTDALTFAAVMAERTMLNQLRAGCLAPVGAFSRSHNRELTLTGIVLSRDGVEKISAEATGTWSESRTVGQRVADSLLAQGAERLLIQVRSGILVLAGISVDSIIVAIGKNCFSQKSGFKTGFGMTVAQQELARIASLHGVNIDDVVPMSVAQRREKLQDTLAEKNVPFPISADRGRRYLDAFDAGEPFGVGSLSETTVDLGKYTNTQHYDNYNIEEHLSWACLIADQQQTKHKFACKEYLQGEAIFEIGDLVIPDYYLLNARIYQQTQWQLATVSMIIPAELFFTCHSQRFFPVTTFMRPLGTDYLKEPDIGHDVAGHVATFTIPAVADLMKHHGDARDMIYSERDDQLALATSQQQAQSIRAWADELLLYSGRLYWFTVEFGLVMQDGQVRDFGAGILSSPGETRYSIESNESNRVLIDPSDDVDLLRLATTDYLISEFQKTYFVMESFDQLESLTPARILAISKLAMELPHYTWREIVPGDKVINVGSVVTSPNEKYFRLMAGQPIDACLTRAAIRNLRMFARGFDREKLNHFRISPPTIPDSVIQWFKDAESNGTIAKIESSLPK